MALLVPPVGLPAAWTYYRQGFTDLRTAALIGAGFFVGGLLGARLATGLSHTVLEKVFGVALVLIAARMIVAK